MAVKVASRLRGMSDEAFREAFGREEQCRAALVHLRWPDGFVCPSCGHRGHCLYSFGRAVDSSNREAKSAGETGELLPLWRSRTSISLILHGSPER